MFLQCCILKNIVDLAECLCLGSILGVEMMDGLTAFVDAIYEYESKEKAVREYEEDQILPDKDVLEEVCQVLLNVSCMREEGRFPSFRVSFINPDSELLSAYIYSHVLRFINPIEFNTRNLHKLAPALNPAMSYLMVDINKKPYRIIGMIASYTTWEKIMTRQLMSGNRMPRIPNILVNGPGELDACFGENSIVNYCSGSCVFFRTNTFTSTLIAEALTQGTEVDEKERLQLLYMILWRVTNYGHGAAVLIVPDEESCREFIDLKYQLESPYLFDNGFETDIHSSKVREKDIVTYADFIAKLTSVDGSVVLTKNFELLGFGAETLVDKMDSKHPDMCFIRYDDTVDVTRQFKDNGMRHRAAYRFCSAVEGSVAFVVSQDRSIEACTKHDGKVFVYDNVSLPLS